MHSPKSYALAPGVVSRTGAIAVAALVLVPLAGLAARRRWSAFVLGGTVLVLVLELFSFVFPHFSDFVSLSQSRRAAGFVPFAFALVGGAAVLARLGGLLLPPAALLRHELGPLQDRHVLLDRGQADRVAAGKGRHRPLALEHRAHDVAPGRVGERVEDPTDPFRVEALLLDQSCNHMVVG